MRIAIGDVRLFFEVEGAKLTVDGAAMRERPSLLLLHGGPGFDHSLFKPRFEKLRDQFQLIYLDHRGNGRSDWGSASRWRLEQWADDIRAFCDALELERPVVLGVSFGGIVAQAYATRHPDHAGAMVLCSTTGKFRRDRVLATFERLGGSRAREAASAFFDGPSSQTLADYARICLPLYTRRPVDPNVLGRCVVNPEVLISFFTHEWRSFDFLPALSRVKCRTLVLSGEDDPITPLADGQDLAAALPAATTRFERFAGCGHPVYEDDEDRCFATIREFLRFVSS
jgi:pimeloyl-ACP methyl ester carboxylesterase